MKRLFAVAVVLFTAGALFAVDIDLGSFPTGTWLDPNYDAVWEFSATAIRILDTDGVVLWDFSSETISDFKVGLDGTQPVLSFSCARAGRSYQFVKPLTNTNIILKIDREGLPQYTVDMKKQ